MIDYHGERTIEGPCVTRDGLPLHTGIELHCFSTRGMDWGCDSADSRQLAFAILFDHLQDAKRARVLAPIFSRQVVQTLDNEWVFDSEFLQAVIARIEAR